MAAESQSSAANMRTLGSSKASAAEQQEEEELETAPEPPKISTSPVVYTALSTWILAVSSVHVSVILFDRDVFAIPWLQGPYMSIDAWSLVHVFFYYAVALSYPNRFWGMMALGVLWEVLEAWFAGQTGNEWMGKVWEERGVNSLWVWADSGAAFPVFRWANIRPTTHISFLDGTFISMDSATDSGKPISGAASLSKPSNNSNNGPPLLLQTMEHFPPSLHIQSCLHSRHSACLSGRTDF